MISQFPESLCPSDTYLAILEEGAVREAKKLIVCLGNKLLGAPGESVIALLAVIEDLEHLERIYYRLVEVKTWQELIEMP